MDIIKIVCACIICSVIFLLIRQVKPEFMPLIQIAGSIVIFSVLFEGLKNLLSNVIELADGTGSIYSEYIIMLLRVLGIALITKIGSDICKDSGNSVLSFMVELAGKTVILLYCFPLLKTVISLANGVLN